MRKKWFLIPLLCFVLVLSLFRYVIYIGYVPTDSMEPTIMAGDKIFGIRILGELEVGDVIIFEYEGTYMVKRIAAVPGDTLKINREEIKIPKDCYYVLGDNYWNSFDSRYWQEPYITYDDIVAKIIYK